MSRYVWSPVLGLAVLAMTAWMMTLAPKAIVHPTPDLPRSPMTAFELVRTPAQLAAVIGEDPATSDARRVRDAFDRENRWDFPFMAIYGLFVASLFWAARQRSGARWLLVGLALPVVCVAADALEDLVLFQLTAGAGNPQALLGWLQLFTWVKWGGLGLATLLAGLVMGADRSRMRLRVAGLIGAVTAAAAFAATVAAYAAPARFAGAMALGIAGAWVVQMIYTALKTIDRPNPAPAG